MKKVLSFTIVIICLTSCMLIIKIGKLTNKKSFKYDYKSYLPYLTEDSLYKTIEDKVFLLQLKDTFIKIYNDYKRNCYFDDLTGGKIYRYDIKTNSFLHSYKVSDVRIPLILFNNSKDSALILFTFTTVLHDSSGNALTFKKNKGGGVTNYPVRIRKEKNKWVTQCEPITYGSVYQHTNDAVKIVEESNKKAIIRASYFKKDKTPDPTFWKRFFTNSAIFHPDPYKQKWPLN